MIGSKKISKEWKLLFGIFSRLNKDDEYSLIDHDFFERMSQWYAQYGCTVGSFSSDPKWTDEGSRVEFMLKWS